MATAAAEVRPSCVPPQCSAGLGGEVSPARTPASHQLGPHWEGWVVQTPVWAQADSKASRADRTLMASFLATPFPLGLDTGQGGDSQVPAAQSWGRSLGSGLSEWSALQVAPCGVCQALAHFPVALAWFPLWPPGWAGRTTSTSFPHSLSRSCNVPSEATASHTDAMGPHPSWAKPELGLPSPTLGPFSNGRNSNTRGCLCGKKPGLICLLQTPPQHTHTHNCVWQVALPSQHAQEARLPGTQWPILPHRGPGPTPSLIPPGRQLSVLCANPV